MEERQYKYNLYLLLQPPLIKNKSETVVQKISKDIYNIAKFFLKNFNP